MDYGQVPIMKEYGPQVDVRTTVQFGLNDVDSSYRGYRQEWEAIPYTLPDIVAENRTVYMSWNGATNVTSWAVYRGQQNMSSNLALTGTVENVGFETSFNVPNGTNYAKVGAYNGNVLLRESNVILVTG
jgi:hypothetical protein